MIVDGAPVPTGGNVDGAIVAGASVSTGGNVVGTPDSTGKNGAVVLPDPEGAGDEVCVTGEYVGKLADSGVEPVSILNPIFKEGHFTSLISVWQGSVTTFAASAKMQNTEVSSPDSAFSISSPNASRNSWEPYTVADSLVQSGHGLLMRKLKSTSDELWRLRFRRSNKSMDGFET